MPPQSRAFLGMQNAEPLAPENHEIRKLPAVPLYCVVRSHLE